MASLLSGFPTVSASYVRPTGSYVNGEWVQATAVPISFSLVSPQPADGRSLEMLPEGDRQYQHLKTWTETALQPDDLVTLNSEEYRVVLAQGYDQSVEGWGFEGFTQILMRRTTG